MSDLTTYPFHTPSDLVPGPDIDPDAIASLRVLHTLCQQQAAALTAATAEHDRANSVTSTLEEISVGAYGHAAVAGDTWDALLIQHRWALTRFYANSALGYAANASRCAALLRVGKTPVRFVNWPHTTGTVEDEEDGPGLAWLLADLSHRLPRLQLPAPDPGDDPRLSLRLAAEITAVNVVLSRSHQRMLDTVGPLATARPDDLLADQAPLDDYPHRHRDEPRLQQLREAADALHTYAAACTRAVVLLAAQPSGDADG